MADSLADLSRKLDRVADDLKSPALVKRVAEKAVGDIAEAVRGDLGDLSMSRWMRSAPVEIVGAVERAPDGGFAVAPVRRARGPMRVLESGRNAYAAGDRRVSGSRVSKKTGERTTKTRKVKRAGAGTGGRGTWSDAEALIVARTGGRFEQEAQAVMARQFMRG